MQNDHGNLKAKREFIDALFEDLHAKIDRLDEFFEQGHHDEAMTLCCVYLDGIANNVYPDSDRSAFNFVQLLREHGEDTELDLISPLALVRWIKDERPTRANVADNVSQALATKMTELRDEDALIGELGKLLTGDDLEYVKKEVWRGSVAYVAYRRLRVPFIHQIRGYSAVVVGSAAGKDEEISVDFRSLHTALKRIARTFHDLSRRKVKWFGHDFKNKA